MRRLRRATTTRQSCGCAAERAPRQRLGGHERQREERREADEPRRHQSSSCCARNVERGSAVSYVIHSERELVDGCERLQAADGDAPERGLAPQHLAPPHHEEQADADAADDVEERHADDRADADGLVGRAHARVAPGEGLGDLDEVRNFGQPVAGDDEPQPVAALLQASRTCVRR